MKRIKFELSTLLTLVAILIVFNSWLLPLFSNTGPDISSNFEPIVNSFPLPWTWAISLTGDGMGVFAAPSLWTYPAQSLYQVFLMLNIPFWFQMKYLAFLPMLLITIYGIKRLSSRFDSDWRISTVLYLFNTYYLTVLDGGQLNLAIAYSFLPLAFDLFLSTFTKKRGTLLTFILLLFCIGSFDLRIIFLLYFIIGIYLLIYRNCFVLGVIRICISSISLLLINLYWIIPIIFQQKIFSSGYATTEQLTQFSFTTTLHSLFLSSPNWYTNIFGQVEPVRWYFFILPLLAFITVFHIHKYTKYLICVAIVGVFMAKGSNSPLAEIYTWSYANISVFKLFRDASKFFILIIFSYSFLIGQIVRKVSLKTHSQIPIIVTLLGVFLLAYPSWTGGLTGTFSPPFQQSIHTKLTSFLQQEQDFYRTFWMPSKPPNAFVSVNHPSTEAQWFVQKRPFTTNITGSYELFNFVRSSAAGELLGLTSTKYLFYSPVNPKNTQPKPADVAYFDWFTYWFNTQSWLTPVPGFSEVGMHRLTTYQPRFFSTNVLLWVIGPDDTYEQIVENNGFRLDQSAIVHLQEFPSLFNRIPEFLGIRQIFIFNKTDVTDLAFSQVDASSLISPSVGLLKSGDDPTGWWRRDGSDFLSLKEFLQDKYLVNFHEFDNNQGYAISEGSHQLSIPISKDGILYARVLESSSSGQLKFSNSDSELVTLSPLASLRWRRIGPISDGTLTISSQGSINILNSLAIVSEDFEKTLLKNAQDLLDTHEYLDSSNLSSLQLPPSLKPQYSTTNPTHHTVQVGEAPTLLLFTDNYDPSWKTQTGSFPSYSMINTFYIPSPGTYETSFTPQKFVLPSLMISIFIISGMIVALLLIFQQNKK